MLGAARGVLFRQNEGRGVRCGEVHVGHGLVESAPLQLGFKASAEGLLVVAQAAEFLAPFLDGPLVVLVAVLQVEADEEEAEERGERKVSEHFGAA